MGFVVLNPRSTYARLAWFTHPSRKSYKTKLSIARCHFFVYGNFEKLEKNLGAYVLILINCGFGTKPMISSASYFIHSHTYHH